MKLDFTKFFDVKSPIGIHQTENMTEFNNIGVDLYMPRPTLEFVDALIQRNEKIVEFHHVVREEGTNKLTEFGIYSKKGVNCPLIQYKNEKYYIFGNICIPTGIGILIPINYYIKLICKSSNFGYDFTVIEGTIDENYTYGMGMQLNLLDKDLILMIDPNQKVCQITLHKANFIEELNELPQEEWSTNSMVIARRINRTGGFGNTGKF